jgi:hypothetical protein
MTPRYMEDRAMVERHLAEAEAHVAKGQEHVARQIEIVGELERGGHERAAQAARDLLATFELTQAASIGDRDRLRAQLAAFG